MTDLSFKLNDRFIDLLVGQGELGEIGALPESVHADLVALHRLNLQPAEFRDRAMRIVMTWLELPLREDEVD